MTRKTIADGLKRLAEIPGDDDVILDDTDASSESAAETPEPSGRQPAPAAESKLPAATKPQVVATGAQPVNLDDLTEFRQYKSKVDQTAAEKARRIAELEEELTRRRESEAAAQQATLAAQINQTVDPTAREQLINQLAAIRSSQYVDGWRRWEQYMAAEIAAAGVDAKDPLFQKQYSGPEGAAQFAQDVLVAKLTQAERRAADAEKQLAGLPTQVDEIVKRRFAELARQSGFDVIDAGEERQPPVSSDTTDIEKAIRDFNQGRINFNEFKRRTSG